MVNLPSASVLTESISGLLEGKTWYTSNLAAGRLVNVPLMVTLSSERYLHPWNTKKPKSRIVKTTLFRIEKVSFVAKIGKNDRCVSTF